MSQHRELTPNGDPHQEPTEHIDNAVLLAHIKVCIIQSDLAAKESTRAREAAEDALQLVQEVRRATTRIASDQFELRTGVPPTWRRRALLAAIAATVGAMVGALAGAAAALITRGIL